MILIELADYIINHWQEVTVNGILLLLLRKYIIAEVRKLIYLNRDEESKWIREKVESLSGEIFVSQQPFYKRAWTRYTEKFYSYSRKETQLGNQRRKTKMKTYLKKLGKTKLQAFLLASFINIALLVGYLMDLQDIQSKVDAWMPMANMVVQLILTIVYQWVEGSIDKASLKATGKEYTTEDFR